MILFVDDEPRRMAPHLEALELTFEGRRALKHLYYSDTNQADWEERAIVYCAAVDVAKQVIDAASDALELVILDIMMPPYEYNMIEVAYGMRTGVLFYEDLRVRNVDVPVIILTNDHDEELRRRFENEPHCVFIHKGRCTPSQLCREVERQLSTGM